MSSKTEPQTFWSGLKIEQIRIIQLLYLILYLLLEVLSSLIIEYFLQFAVSTIAELRYALSVVILYVC